MGTRTISASRFKESCLSLLDTIGPEGVDVTKHGKPVAKLVPIEVESSNLIGSLRDKITVRGSLLSTGLDWNAEP